MTEMLMIRINDETFSVVTGTTVAAALLNSDQLSFRKSVTGTARAPLCAMGVCFECRVTIDGIPQQRACMVICRDAMEIVTDA